jgi:hypothetical protein
VGDSPGLTLHGGVAHWGAGGSEVGSVSTGQRRGKGHLLTSRGGAVHRWELKEAVAGTEGDQGRPVMVGCPQRMRQMITREEKILTVAGVESK